MTVSDDDLGDFERDRFRHDGKERALFRKGTGPAVIVMTEIPGISPKVADVARRVVDAGMTAVMPHLFGRPGVDPNPDAHGTLATLRYGAEMFVPACISREFTVLATGKTSPVVDWLRALAAHEHERCGGPGVGAVGMCFTGGFALAMATDDRLLAPVMSQPSLPLTLSVGPWRGPAGQRSALDVSAEDLDVIRTRCAAQDLQVMGLRFKGDRFVPPERFARLRHELGDAFIAVELDDDAANPKAEMRNPHSVLTEHLIDEVGEPTRAALDQVLEFLARRLGVTDGGPDRTA